MTHKEQLHCPITINFESGGKPNFWLYPIDKFHMEIADETQWKTKIVLYFLCLSKPVAHLSELPTHEAEYDMIDKAAAEKEREDREKKLLAEAMAKRSHAKALRQKLIQENKKNPENKTTESANKLPSIASSHKLPINQVSTKRLNPRANKEWWEKFNFSNPVLLRYRFENKYNMNGAPIGQPFYVRTLNSSSTSRRQSAC